MCRSVFLNKVASFHPAALLKRHSSKGIFKQTFFIEHIRVTASKYMATFKEVFNLIEILKENIS